MRVLICGGRNYSNKEKLFSVLNDIHNVTKIKRIIHGGASGADLFAGQYANSIGIQCLIFPALWTEYGKKAGPIRNQLMIDDGKPDRVIAFPGGRGTADMVQRAMAANIPVTIIEE